MSRVLRLLALLLMLVGCRTTTPAEKHAPLDHPMLAVVILNLYHDKDDWPRRRVQIVETLKALQPEVIALQEVLQHENLPNQAQWLADQLGYDWHFVSVDSADKPRRYGNAVLTRLPVLARDQQALQPLEDSRSVGMLRVELEGNPINVYVTHLHHTEQGGAMRAQQLDGVMAFITTTSDGFPSIVAGDFNSPSDAPKLAALRTDFVDTYGMLHPAATASESSTLNLHYFTPARIDHVFHQRDAFTPVSAQVILNHADAHGVWPSDHYGLSVELQLIAKPGRFANPR